MTTRYRFTIRPPSQYHCPAGWIPDSMTFKDPTEHWNYGTVTYPERLSYKDADHFSLDPDGGPRIVSAVVFDSDGETIGGIEVAFSPRDLHETLYDLAVGTVTVDELDARLAERAASYDVTIAVDYDLNVDNRSLPLWRDIPQKSLDTSS